MKTFCLRVLVLAGSIVNAQFGGGSVFDMNYRPFAVLQRKDIRQELKLSKEQSKQIDDVMKELNKQARTGDPSTGMAMMGKFDETDKTILAVLDDAQRTRLSEIRIQIRGATSLSDPEVAAKLELTGDQTATVKKLRAEAMDKFVKGAQSGQRNHMDKLMEEISKDEEKGLLAALTDAQRELLSKLAGKPYKDARLKGTWPI